MVLALLFVFVVMPIGCVALTTKVVLDEAKKPDTHAPKKPSGRTRLTPDIPAPAFRTWVHVDGRRIEAKYISSTATDVTFERKGDALIFTFPIANLSRDDREYVDLQNRRQLP